MMDRFFTGINYWGSKSATRMWDEYDPDSIDADMSALQSVGITHLRVFPLWSTFQPLMALYTTKEEPFEYCFVGEIPLPDTEAGRAGVSEEACRHFEHFCATAEKYGLKLIVGLITGHMSFREFAPPAFAGKHRLSDTTVLKWQLRFVRYFVRRFKAQPCIVGWDLGNEVNNMIFTKDFVKDDFYVWCSAISDAIRACDGAHPVISGMDSVSIDRTPDNLITVRETCDMHTAHKYNIFSEHPDPQHTMYPILSLPFSCRMSEDISGIPTFLQEFGSIGYTNCSQKVEAAFYRAAMYATLTHDCHGLMWWCAFDQGHLRFAPYNWNNIGSDYGFFDKDFHAKPIAAENLRFRELLSKLPDGNLPRHTTDAVILVPRDNHDADPQKLQACFALAKQANIDLRFAYSLEELPDAPLYFMPSLASNQSIPATRLDMLLKKVESGAVLYLSFDSCLFRQLPEITGVTIAWRDCNCPGVRDVCFGENTLPMELPIRYELESCTADILARDATGSPIFFAKKRGKGWVYLLLAPLERYLSERHGAFWMENQPRYDSIYRELARAAGISRLADTDSPFVRLTEHPIDDRHGYLAAINYSHQPRTTTLSLNGIRLLPFHGGTLCGHSLSLDADDGAIFRYERL